MFYFLRYKKVKIGSHAHVVPKGTQLFFIEIMTDSHAVIRNNREVPYTYARFLPTVTLCKTLVS